MPDVVLTRIIELVKEHLGQDLTHNGRPTWTDVDDVRYLYLLLPRELWRTVHVVDGRGQPHIQIKPTAEPNGQDWSLWLGSTTSVVELNWRDEDFYDPVLLSILCHSWKYLIPEAGGLLPSLTTLWWSSGNPETFNLLRSVPGKRLKNLSLHSPSRGCTVAELAALIPRLKQLESLALSEEKGPKEALDPLAEVLISLANVAPKLRSISIDWDMLTPCLAVAITTLRRLRKVEVIVPPNAQGIAPNNRIPLTNDEGLPMLPPTSPRWFPMPGNITTLEVRADSLDMELVGFIGMVTCLPLMHLTMSVERVDSPENVTRVCQFISCAKSVAYIDLTFNGPPMPETPTSGLLASSSLQPLSRLSWMKSLTIGTPIANLSGFVKMITKSLSLLETLRVPLHVAENEHVEMHVIAELAYRCRQLRVLALPIKPQVDGGAIISSFFVDSKYLLRARLVEFETIATPVQVLYVGRMVCFLNNIFPFLAGVKYRGNDPVQVSLWAEVNERLAEMALNPEHNTLSNLSIQV